MPYNETTVQRIREILLEKNVDFTEKKMFSGICFMVDDKMCFGTHIDKNSGDDYLMCRVGDAAYEKALEMSDVIPMDFSGKSMKGYVFVTGNGHKNNADLEKWLQCAWILIRLRNQAKRNDEACKNRFKQP